jgi:hypothetical protein
MSKKQITKNINKPAQQVYRELVTINGKNVALAHNQSKGHQLSLDGG